MISLHLFWRGQKDADYFLTVQRLKSKHLCNKISYDSNTLAAESVERVDESIS